MFFCTNDKTIKKTKSELEARWNGVVLLIEKNEIESAIGAEKNNLSWVFPLLCIGLFLSILFMVEESLQTKLFFIFPVIGILFSIAST
ncbi:hypothetical protein ACQ9BO_20255 [Flavobacterium sp. P21]|uniref:hypothetical protein n=1 Tax=Flavobacterium sp. P21 TaxID=3423948 RepID=UPI003D66CD09